MIYELSDVFIFLTATALVVVFLAMFIMKFIVSVYFPFIDEYEHIKHKIVFSSHHDEREYWKREKKRLYVSYIPLVGSFFASRMKPKKRKY